MEVLALTTAILLLCVVVPLGQSQPITGADLPRRPEFACNTPAVLSAFAKCGFVGANGTGCCSGLDAVFANRSSPSFGCLCYPPVLYQAHKRASFANMDIMGLLWQCRRLHSNFTTQWSTANPTDCPDLPMDVNAASLAPFIGDASLTGERGRDTPQWAWSNLLQLGHAAGHWTPHVYTILDDLFGIKLVQIMIGVFVALPLAFVAVNAVLLRLSGVYRALPQAARLVTVHHGVYAVLFGLSLVPQTYLTLQALFCTLTGTMIASRRLTFLLGLFVVPRFALYLMEAGARAVVKPNALLTGQRITAVATGFIVVVSRNPGVLPLALLMDLCAVYEAPMYAMLVSRRLQWDLRYTRTLLYAGLAVYVASRVFQLVALVYMVVGLAAMPAVAATPEFGLLAALYLGYATLGSVVNLLIYRRIGMNLCPDELLLPPAPGQAALDSGAGSSVGRGLCDLWAPSRRRQGAGHGRAGKPNPAFGRGHQADAGSCRLSVDASKGADGAVIVGDTSR